MSRLSSDEGSGTVGKVVRVMTKIRYLALTGLLLGCGLWMWALPVGAAEQAVFEEKFSGQLSPGWAWIDEQPGSWRFDEGLELKVVPEQAGLWADGRKHTNLLLREAAMQV